MSEKTSAECYYVKVKHFVGGKIKEKEKEAEVEVLLSRVKAKAKENKEWVCCKHFKFYWKCYLAVLFPLLFYVPLAWLERSLTVPLATITAAGVAGCVSLVVLLTNTVNERLKLKEKWIFNIRGLLQGYVDSIEDLNNKVGLVMRPELGLKPHFYSNDECKDLSITMDQMYKVESKLEELFESDISRAARSNSRKLEMSLAATDGAENILLKVKCVYILIGYIYSLSKRKNVEYTKKAVEINRLLNRYMIDDVVSELIEFLGVDFKDAMDGGGVHKSNIRALYCGIISLVSSFILYNMIDSIFLTNVDREIALKLTLILDTFWY